MIFPWTSADDSSRKHPTSPRAWLLLAPLLGWLALFVVAPTLILLAVSFCQRDELGRIVWSFTTENYARLFDATYWNIFVRSVGYAALTTLLCLVGGYPVAWFIARQTEPARSRWLLLVMIPFWASFLVRTFAWITILKSEGLLNGLLQSLRLISVPAELLYTPGAVVVGLVYTYLPFAILPIYASVEKMDRQLLEAAADLGAHPFATFRKVILPLTRPGIMAAVLLVFVPAVGMFAISDLLGGARVPLIGNVIENQFLQARNWPFGAALGMVLLALFALTAWLGFGRKRGAVAS
ncbi:MAG: ABC transporter permease [Verrucomicrobia bacterium]|nr:ABC transporter permease [Verrucomicrobiota bacterium]